MIYPQRNKSRRNQKLIVPLIILALLAAGGWAFLRFAPNTSYEASVGVAVPIWKFRAFMGQKFSYIGTFFSSHKTLVEENNRLTEALLKAEADRGSYEILVSEHEKLLDAYGRTSTSSSARMLGVVLAKPPQSPYDSLVLDLGTSEGALVGDHVYGLGDVALGVITSVTDHTSSATLFSSSEKETAATVERSDVSLVLSGTGGGGFEAKVPQDVDVTIGDTIVLPSVHVSVVGRVVAIESTAASSFKRVVVQSPVNIHSVRWVEVARQ